MPIFKAQSTEVAIPAGRLILSARLNFPPDLVRGLLIVGGNDEAAPDNLEAWARLRCEKAIEIVPGAGPRFEEPGALDKVAALAARWFSQHLGHAAKLFA